MKAFLESVTTLVAITVVLALFALSSFVISVVILAILGSAIGAVYAALGSAGIIKIPAPTPPLDENGEPWVADISDIYKGTERGSFLRALNFSQRMLLKTARLDKPKYNKQLADLVAWDIRRRLACIDSLDNGRGIMDKAVDESQSTIEGRTYDGLVSHFLNRMNDKGKLPRVLKDQISDLLTPSAV